TPVSLYPAQVGPGRRPWPTFQCAPPDWPVGGAFGVVSSPSAAPRATCDAHAGCFQEERSSPICQKSISSLVASRRLVASWSKRAFEICALGTCSHSTSARAGGWNSSLAYIAIQAL